MVQNLVPVSLLSLPTRPHRFLRLPQVSVLDAESQQLKRRGGVLPREDTVTRRLRVQTLDVSGEQSRKGSRWRGVFNRL